MNNGQHHADGASVAWNPESPFLYDAGAHSAPTATATREQGYALESPFLGEFAANGGPGVNTAHAAAFAELMESLRDEEFGESLARVADEASALAESPAYEGESSDRQRSRQAQAAGAYLDRLATQSESALQRLLNETEGKDLGAMSEDALHEYLEGLTPIAGGGDPVSEQFLGGLLKKARKAIGGAVKLAKRGLSAVANVLPHTWILKRLLGLVRPLLKRVLRLAIDRLPVAIRPLARQLAARFLGAAATEAESESEEESGEATTADARLLATEFDTMVAGLTVDGEDFDRHANMEAMLEDRQSTGARDALRDLDRSRNVFVSQLSRMQEGEDPTPAVEQFVPAILAALKLGVNIIGRQKIVRLLSKHMSSLIRPYLGQENANRLSPALVDAGLRLVNLESESDTAAYARVASETLASTVEDTVSQLVQTLPADEWESESMLEAYTRDALETAVAANFPDDTVRSELHEANEVKGVWRRPRGQRYKKYTRVPSVVLTPQIARAIPSFRGVPLRSILRDRFGLVGPIRVHVHLYEAVAGTTPGAITRAEALPGGPESTAATPSAAAPAGASAPAAPAADTTMDQTTPAPTDSEFHPLTEAAAGLLLREPGLGRNVDDRFLETPNALAVGQRLFRLSIATARGAAQQRGRIRRIRARLDIKRGEATVLIYLSETAAQEIAQAMRRSAPAGVVLNMLRRAFESQARAQSEGPSDMVQVSSESLAEDSETVSRRVGRALGRRLRHAVVRAGIRALAGELDRRYAQFTTEFDGAANAPADGVTIRVALRGVPWLAAVRRIASGGSAMREDETVLRRSVASHSVQVAAGYVS